MNEEEKIILKRLERQVEQNNDILKSMRSGDRWSKSFKLLYWVIIIIVGLFVWSLIERSTTGFSDAVDKVVETKDDISESVSGISESLNKIKESTSGVSNFLDNLKE